VCARETEGEKQEEYMCASCECLVKGGVQSSHSLSPAQT